MTRTILSLALAIAFAPTVGAELAIAKLEFESLPMSKNAKQLHLKGADDRMQLLVNAYLKDGRREDATRAVKYEVAPKNVVTVDKAGFVRPAGNGTATITAKFGEITTVTKVSVEKFETPQPINFANAIVPIFTKAGCNGGGCHGKSGGQNGFRLSLLGFEPQEDYEYLVKEARMRRIFPAAPDHSLLLRKGAAVVPHGGGKKIEVDSHDYNLLRRWIAQGMPFGNADDPTVTRIEVFPRERVMKPEAKQQLSVFAHYSDGHVEDVTRASLFEPNEKEVAEVDEHGLVSMHKQPGDVAVMVRYQGKVAVSIASLPLGAPVKHLPPEQNFIDTLVFKKLKKVGMPPSELSDDETFIRRVSIDVAGRLPNKSEVEKFLASKDPKKREKWVDSLLASTDYADYFANYWGALLRNQRTVVGGRTEPYMRGTYAFHSWIRESLHRNKPYDVFVREIVAASGDIGHNPPVAWYRQVKTSNQQLEDTAQLFLGTRLQCAQCHHHPFEKWSQADYYSFGAFFSQISRRPGSQPGEEMIYASRRVPTGTNKKNSQKVMPAGLGASPVTLTADDDARHVLVDWMANSENRFFAHALVNRYWKHFFNRGLVEPEDDMRETNPATNPELLDALADNFIKSGFDLKKLVRSIVTSSTYQLSAIPNSHNAKDKQYFSRYYPKRLTAEVLLDAINSLTKSENKWTGLPTGTRAVQLPDNYFNSKSYFLQVFGRPDSASACACERSQDASLAQSLHLLNSKDIQAKLSADAGRAAELASNDKLNDEQKMQELYLWAFSRKPMSHEANVGIEHVEKKLNRAKEAKSDIKLARREAYEDIVWALISSKEFLFNH
ncbi:MAG: S-layer protein [Verrucomicrobiales bacterium]|nr:S-layer protein [Verrucomicrobiales bacterium]|tara:strand:- start:8608 stop:11115 length:2508 start_codon:yes stop_codon:yes gene_type:complete